VGLGETKHLHQVYALEVERGLLYVATSPHTAMEYTLEEHTAKFQTCPMAVQDFARSMIEGLDQLHGMDISHGSIRPEAILLDDSKLVISDFSRARLVDVHDTSVFQSDMEMAASTILFGLCTDLQGNELDFNELLAAAKTGFATDSLFDGIRAGRLETMDLIRTLVGGKMALHDLLSRPFFWSHDKAAKFLGEEIGNLLDPGAARGSKQYPFIEALEARGDQELGGSYDERAKQDGPSWAALLDPDYPLEGARSAADGDPTGWGSARNAQQPPHVIEHDFAVYGKKPGAKQKATRESQLESGKTVQPMANRRTVGLLKTIRNIAFAHRSQHVQVGRFHTEEDVMRYMLNPFPWLLMAVYQLDQEHKIAGSVAEASVKTSESAVSTEGESTSREDSGKKSGMTTTSADKVVVPKKKEKQGKKGKDGHGPKAPNQQQKDKKFQMLKEAFAKSQAEVVVKDTELAQQAAELAQLRSALVPTEQPNQEPAPALEKDPQPEQLESIQLTTKDPKDVVP
jgi:hypothetical protein